MALFIKQETDRSELQKRLETELQEKLKKRADLDNDLPDGVDDAAYLENKKATGANSWIWLLLFVAALLGSLWIIIF